MHPCRMIAAIGLLAASTAMAAEPPARRSSPSPQTKARIQRDVNYAGNQADERGPVVREPVVMMPIMRVDELPEKLRRGLDEAIAQQRRLDSGARVSSDRSKNVVTQAFLPPRLEPSPDGGQRALFPVLSFAW